MRHWATTGFHFSNNGIKKCRGRTLAWLPVWQTNPKTFNEETATPSPRNCPQTNQAANKQTSFDSQLASLCGHQCKPQPLTSKYLKKWHGDLKLVSKAFVCAQPPRTSKDLKKWSSDRNRASKKVIRGSTVLPMMPAHSSLVVTDSRQFVTWTVLWTKQWAEKPASWPNERSR